MSDNAGLESRRCNKCGEPYPTVPNCPGCGEQIIAAGRDPSATCDHGLLPVIFEQMRDGRYRALVFGEVIHRCLTEKEKREVADFSASLSELVPETDDGTVRRQDQDGDEAWMRLTAEPHLFGVEAIRHEVDGWQLSFWVLEYVREEPLESRLRAEIEHRVRAVDGVTDVQQEDREVYWVTGATSGDQLAQAAAAAVDALADDLRRFYDELA